MGTTSPKTLSTKRSNGSFNVPRAKIKNALKTPRIWGIYGNKSLSVFSSKGSSSFLNKCIKKWLICKYKLCLSICWIINFLFATPYSCHINWTTKSSSCKASFIFVKGIIYFFLVSLSLSCYSSAKIFQLLWLWQNGTSTEWFANFLVLRQKLRKMYDLTVHSNP